MSTLRQFVGANPTGALSVTIATDNFTLGGIIPSDLGTWSSGGHVICKASSNAWIVAPRCADVSRTWYCRDDAVLIANACSGFSTGWFVPTCGQLQNPGYTCRTYWDLFSSTCYWSSTENSATTAWYVTFTNGSAGGSLKANTFCVRAFRCVTY